MNTNPPPKHNPVVKYSVHCPMCGVDSVQYRLNPRLFWNESQDIDLQPRGLKFMPGLEGYHPPFYYMWHCANCRWTAGHQHFSDPLKDVNMPLEIVQKKLKDSYQGDARFRSVVDKLSEGIDTQNPDFYSVTKLYLLGIFMRELIQVLLKQDFGILAKYYLRLAWLHRDMQAMPDDLAKYSPPLNELNAFLKQHWPNLPENEQMGLRKAADCYNLVFEDTHAMKNPVDEINILQLIARIHIKLGDWREARELLADSIDRASKHRAAIDQGLNAPRPPGSPIPTAAERGELVSQSRRLTRLIEDAQSLIEKCSEAMHLR